MSVVVAIKKDGIIYMGADSQVSCGGTRSTLSNPNNYKIWAMSDIDNCLMGSVGTLRANNIIKVASDLIPEIVDLKGNVDFRFVVRHFVPRLMDELDEYKVLCKGKDDAPDMAASFLLAYHDRLYSIEKVVPRARPSFISCKEIQKETFHRKSCSFYGKRIFL